MLKGSLLYRFVPIVCGRNLVLRPTRSRPGLFLLVPLGFLLALTAEAQKRTPHSSQRTCISAVTASLASVRNGNSEIVFALLGKHENNGFLTQDANQLTRFEQTIEPCIADTGIERTVIFRICFTIQAAKARNDSAWASVAACSICAVNYASNSCRNE